MQITNFLILTLFSFLSLYYIPLYIRTHTHTLGKCNMKRWKSLHDNEGLKILCIFKAPRSSFVPCNAMRVKWSSFPCTVYRERKHFFLLLHSLVRLNLQIVKIYIWWHSSQNLLILTFPLQNAVLSVMPSPHLYMAWKRKKGPGQLVD